MNCFKQSQSLNWLVVVTGLGLFFTQFHEVFAEGRVSFEDVVDTNFDQWTAGENYLLSPQRVNDLILRANIRGSEAAAIAAIHSYQKKSGNTEPLTFDQIVAKHSDDPSLRRDQAAAGANVSRNYDKFARHIRSAPRKLFAVERPSSDTMTQGNIGDCYFISAVGSFVQNHPDQMLRMIQQNKDRSFEVQFANGIHVSVPPLTDAQLALGSNAGQQGLWLNVLEVAAGAVRREKEAKTDLSPLDVLGGGGKADFAVHLLTGHNAVRHMIREQVNGKYVAPDENDVPGMAVQLSRVIREGLDRKQIVCCSVGQWKAPPGVITHHVYAVMGMKDGRVDIWNPWGYKYGFEPKGKPGFKNGYYFEGGRCSIPIRDFVRIFREVTVEQPAGSSRTTDQITSR